MPWVCTFCEINNRDAVDRCFRCNAPKPSPLLPSRAAPASRASARGLAELCTYCRAARVTLYCEQCRTATCSVCDAAHHRTREKHAHSRVQHSDSVGANRPPPPAPVGSLLARASPAPAAASRPKKPNSSSGGEQWPCATCTFVNESTEAVCGMCGVHDTGERPVPVAPDPAQLRSTSPLLVKQPNPSSQSPWSCSACTFANAAASADCSMCGAFRPPPSPKRAAPVSVALPAPAPALPVSVPQPRPIEFASFRRGRETVYVKIIQNSGQDALIVEFAGGEQICLMRDDFFEGDLCINVLPPDDILRQYNIEPRREALVLSRQRSESGSTDSIAALSRQMERNAHLGCEDAQNLPALVPPPPINPSHEIHTLNIHDRVDVRDLKSGKWRPAEVQGFFQSTVFLRYFARGAQDESTIDESIDAATDDNRARFAQFKSLCEGNPSPLYPLARPVEVCMPASTGASPVRWRSGRVIAVEGPQVCVQLLALPECRYWFHSTNDASAMRLAMPDGPSSPSAGSTAGRVLPTAGPAGPAQSAPAMAMTPIAPQLPPRVRGVYSIDDVLVVYNRKLRAWEEATVIDVSGSEVLVRPFFQTTRSRDRWLDINLRANDIEHLGDLVDSADQDDIARRQAEQEVRFAETLALRNPPEVVREVGGDGNCLYRAFAYQLFGTEDLHAEVREECFAYMIANREYFQQFVDGDFDTYIRTHSPNREHGDHIEVVAMAERFNKRVRMDTVEAAGNWADGSVYAAEPALQSLGCVRLMYVGRNHYRCVVCRDPRLDGPLGDGSGDVVRLSRFRAEQDQLHAPVSSAALAAAAEPLAFAERQPRSPLSASKPAAAHGDTVDIAEPVASRPLFSKNSWRLTAAEKLAIWNGSSKEVGAVPAATVEIMFQQAVGHWTRRVQAMYGPVPSHVLISLQMELGEYFSDWRRRAASGRLWRNFAVYAMLDEAQDSVVEAFIVEILRQ